MSATVSAEQVRELREKTGIALMTCKKALQEAGGDMNKATDILRKKGMETAAKKSSRATKEGRVFSYIHHNGKVGVLIEVGCESDFVAKDSNFEEFLKQVTMHIAAAKPAYLNREQVPQEIVDKEREIYAEQVKGKPPAAMEKILEGKLNKFYSQVCLIEQPLVMDPKVTIQEMIKNLVAKLGENIVLSRFARFEIGEEA